MIKKITSIIFFSFISFIALSQNSLIKKWDFTFGGSDAETVSVLIQTADSGYVIGGFTRSDSSGSIHEPRRGVYDYWIIKTDSAGHKQWDKRYGGDFVNRLYAVQQTSDHGYILGGFTTSDSSGDISEHTHGNMDYWIIKTDSMGQKQWDHRYGGSDYDQLSSVIQCSDGGYLLGGWTFSDSTGDMTHHSKGGEDYWIVKTDAIGAIQWEKNYGGNAIDELSALQQTTDGGYILGGITVSDSSGDISQATNGASDFWVVKINSTGTILWEKRFGGSKGEGLSSLQQCTDGGYIFSGGTGSDSTGDVTQPSRDTSQIGTNRGDLWMVRTDSLGIKKWDKRFGGNWIEGSSGAVSQTKNGGYLLGALSYSNASGDKTDNNFNTTQSWILKTDSAGIKIWDKTLYTLLPDGGATPIETGNACYVIANNSQSGVGGFKTAPSFGNTDFWFIKFCQTSQQQLPIASFTVSSDTLCTGGCFDFTNTSFNASSFQWFFPGGNPSSSTSNFPTNICYVNPGSYDVILVATNIDGNDTIKNAGAVNLLPLPQVNLTQHGDTLFATQGLSHYLWYYNNSLIFGDTLYYHVVTQNGDYRVLAFDSNDCSNGDTVFSFNVGLTTFSTFEKPVYIYPNPVMSELNIKGFENFSDAEVVITDLTGRDVYNSRINSQYSQIPVSFLTPGIYTLRLRVESRIFISKFVKR